MRINDKEVATFEATLAGAFDDPDLSCYAIVDHAQDATLLGRFAKTGISVQDKCLLAAAIETEMAQFAPHLVELSPLAADAEAWPDFLQGGARHPASFTVIASRLTFADLWERLSGFSEVVLPDDTDMIFAFWDPAVLGTLTGQQSDLTLHVPLPVLSERQRASLLHGIAAWWYWDRDGNPQQIVPHNNDEAANAHLVALPLKLTQVQVDMLVEAGVPDQLLSMVMENQPHLLWETPAARHYGVMRTHLLAARKLKQYGMRDILNYTCAALIYGDAIKTDPVIVALLEQVKEGAITLDAALKQLSERQI
jgi:hypothetical protein